MRSSQKSWWISKVHFKTTHILGGRVDLVIYVQTYVRTFLGPRVSMFVVWFLRLSHGFTTMCFTNLNSFMDEPVGSPQAT